MPRSLAVASPRLPRNTSLDVARTLRDARPDDHRRPRRHIDLLCTDNHDTPPSRKWNDAQGSG